jgi:antitoxin component YwqK of YwqJK toxin-antitoxin module
MRLSHFILCLMSSTPLATAYAAGIGGQNCEYEGKPIQDPDRVEFEKKSGVVLCKDEKTGILRTERRYDKGRLTYQKLSHPNGKMRSEIEYFPNGNAKFEKRGSDDGSFDWMVNNEKGSQHGVRRRFFANGKIDNESTYDDGTITGKSTSYFDSGQVMLLRHYERGGAPVVEIRYREDGQVVDLTCAAKSIIPEDVEPCGFGGNPGTVKTRVMGGGESVMTYVNGKKVATETTGTNQGNSSDSTKDGVRTMRDTYPNGKPKREFVRNTITGEAYEKRFAESGQIVLDRKGGPDGLVQQESEWYLNGQIKRKVFFETNRNKVVEAFDDKGRQVESGAYDMRDRPIGTHRLYDSSGKVAVEMTYEKFREVRRKEFDASGGLVADDVVLEDGSTKPASK